MCSKKDISASSSKPVHPTRRASSGETLVPSGIADKLRGVGRVLSDEVGVQQIPAFLIKAHRKPALFAIVCGSLSVF
jgi:hypothetical protein